MLQHNISATWSRHVHNYYQVCLLTPDWQNKWQWTFYKDKVSDLNGRTTFDHLDNLQYISLNLLMCWVRNEMKWIGLYRLNWARRASWGWWDDWDDTVLQTQDSKFETWRSEAEHATSRSRRLPTILTFTRGWGRNIFVSFKPPSPGTEPRTLAWKAAVLTTTLEPPPWVRKKYIA